MSESTGRRIARRWAAPVATALVASLLAAYLWRSRSFIAESYALDPALFTSAAALTGVGLVLRGQLNRLHFNGLGISLPLRDWFRLITMSSFTNYLPFSAGLLAKGVFLKRVHDVPYGRFAVGQTTLMVLILATNGVMGLVILATRFPDRLFGVVGAGFGALALSGGLLALPQGARRWISSDWFPLADSPRPSIAIVGVAATHVLTVVLSSLGLLLCFRMGVGDVDLTACILFSASTAITRFITIVPGALGIREFLIGGLASLVGFDLRDAVVAATIARAAEVVVLFPLGGALTWSFSRDLSRRH